MLVLTNDGWPNCAFFHRVDVSSGGELLLMFPGFVLTASPMNRVFGQDSLATSGHQAHLTGILGASTTDIIFASTTDIIFALPSTSSFTAIVEAYDHRMSDLEDTTFFSAPCNE